MGHRRDADSRCHDQTDRERGDRDDVLSQIAERRVEGGRVEKRRQDRDQHDVGRQRDRLDPGDEPEGEPTEDKQDRIRRPQDRREHEQCRDRDQQSQQEEILMRAERHRPETARSSQVRPPYSACRVCRYAAVTHQVPHGRRRGRRVPPASGLSRLLSDYLRLPQFSFSRSSNPRRPRQRAAAIHSMAGRRVSAPPFFQHSGRARLTGASSPAM